MTTTWNLALVAILLASLAQPPGSGPVSPPGAPSTGAPAGTTATYGAGAQDETPLGLHVFGLALLGAITTVLVYPTRRHES